MMLGKLDRYVPKIKLDYLIPHTIINSEWIKD